MATIGYQPASWLIQRMNSLTGVVHRTHQPWGILHGIRCSASAYVPASVGTCTALSSVSSSMP
ncbi:hypothetical protein A5653_17595 [Mycobacterium colombiense]|nr:hypothetical protein A5653_17595 [Mycobacterium colombiense]